MYRCKIQFYQHYCNGNYRHGTDAEWRIYVWQFVIVAWNICTEMDRSFILV